MRDAHERELPTPSETEQALARRVEELEQAVEARDDFLAIVGHELRNPIAPSIFQVQLLLEKARDAGDAPIASDWLVPRLEALDRRLARFLEILTRLLDVSRLGAGRLELDLEWVHLGELVRDVTSSFDRALALAGCELRLHLAEGPAGFWDRSRIEQVINNLLSNAIRYGAGRPIDVSVEEDPEEARLWVRDEGPGIAEEDQGRIFNRFEQGPTHQRRSSGGFGVGLWLVRKICEAHGGEVQVHSRLGRGAMFMVRLPRRAPASDDKEGE